MRKETKQRSVIKAALYSAALLWMCASCINDTYVDAPESDDATTVNVGLTLRADNVSGDVEGYVQGSTYENYIDIDGGDYRIYFFTNSASGGNDTYLATFTPLDMVNYYYSDYTEYRLYGEVAIPDVIDSGSFKIMVLANWGANNYDDDALKTTTTIDEICEAGWSTFSAITSADGFVLGESNLIPFYGIHAYSGYTFELGKAIELSEPITLLRAMAKVEVTLETEDVTFSDVTLHRYNATGYCAPYGVYSEADYGQGTDWATDYLPDVHLVNGHNDGDGTPIDRSIPFKQVQEADMDNGIYETWVAYLPEYKNTDADNPDDYSYIAVTVNGRDEASAIYFADYTDGETDNTVMENRFDIQRNNLYHYEVKVDIKGVYVINWTLLDEEEIGF